MTLASGEQHVLTLDTPMGVLEAVIASVGASLRVFRIGSIDLVEPYGENQHKPLCAGAIMAPWVNRLDKGQWTHRGRLLQNNITIFDQQNANHGLLLDEPYELIEKTSSSVTLGAVIYPRDGYPFLVRTTVTYALVATGIEVTHTAVNESAERAPYATGAHPYFKFSAVDSGDLLVFSDAATLTVVNERQIPVAEVATLNSKLDLRSGVRVREGVIDEDFTDLPRDEQGRGHTYLRTADGRGLDVWQDASFKHVVIFTPNYFPTIDGKNTFAAAIEPSTAAPNAFNSGRNLSWLEPSEEFRVSWGVDIIL